MFFFVARVSKREFFDFGPVTGQMWMAQQDQVYLRLTRTLGTTGMATIGTLVGSACKELAALVTLSAAFLLRSHCQPSPARQNGKDACFLRARIHLDCLPLVLGCLITLDRVSGTFLALSVLAITAKFVGAIGSLTAMTGATDPYADTLLYPLGVALRWAGPFFRA